MNLSKISQRALDRFRAFMRPNAMIIENPTEELDEALAKGKNITVFGASGTNRRERQNLLTLSKYAPTGAARDDKNYLFSTRRYAAGAITPGELLYFNQAVGGDGASMGFPALFQLSQLETNLDIPSQAPQGKGFVAMQEGFSCNATANSGDIEQLLDSGSLTFTTQGGQFSLRKGPLMFWPGAMGVSGFGNLQGSESAHNGIADPGAARSLGRLPRVIKPLQNFNYVHVVPRATTASSGGTVAINFANDILGRVWLWGEQVDRIPE